MLTSAKQFTFYLFGKPLFSTTETYTETEEAPQTNVVVLSEEYIKREFKTEDNA